MSVKGPFGHAAFVRARLVAGMGGVVWAWAGGLYAVTPTSLEKVNVPEELESNVLDSFTAMPDGSLVMVTLSDRVLRAIVDGLYVVRWEVLLG
jgi:hypothetical protein